MSEPNGEQEKWAVMTHKKKDAGEARGDVVQGEAGQAQDHIVQGVTCVGLYGEMEVLWGHRWPGHYNNPSRPTHSDSCSWDIITNITEPPIHTA